jgi:hypothetical protein
MRIRPELWLNGPVKGTELPTSCITLSKHEKEFCEFLQNVKVPSGLDEHIKAYFIARSKSSSQCDV